MSGQRVADASAGARQLEVGSRTEEDWGIEDVDEYSDDFVEEEQDDTGFEAHKINASTYGALCIWVLLLLAGYGFQRLCCLMKIPSDCAENREIVQIMRDFHDLLFMGFFIAIVVGIHTRSRFTYLFRFHCPQPRGVIFIAVYFTSIITWGSLDYVPGLKQFSITGGGMKGLSIVLLVVTILCTILLISWHFWHALWHSTWAGFAAYVLSRLAVIAWFLAYIVIHFQHTKINFHFHHYLIAFAAATLAEFNHPVSLLTLAIALGIFVQGLSAYDADPIISYAKWYVTLNVSSVVSRSPLISFEAAEYFSSHCITNDTR